MAILNTTRLYRHRFTVNTHSSLLPLLPRIAFVVNGTPDGAMGHRAQTLASLLATRFSVTLFYRSQHKIRSIFDLTVAILNFDPKICYVFDMAFSGVLSATLCRFIKRSKIIVDTGDAISALAAAVGRSLLGRILTRSLEELSLYLSHQIVVRGSYHQEWLAKRGYRADFIPDGVEPDLFRPMSSSSLRNRLNLQGQFIVGIVGSLHWNPRTNSCYGSDLLEAIHILSDPRISGIIIGGGSGLIKLQERAESLKIQQQIRFLGPVPYHLLPEYINLFDICLSTQTNDLPGQVRTTGKLPLYMSCGRFILASRVGQAARVLPPDMLIDYHGSNDVDYSARLAQRILDVQSRSSILELGMQNRAIAIETFGYPILADRLARIFDDLC